MAIPPRIIQTARSAYLLGPDDVDRMDRLRALHPAYEYRFYDASERRDFVERHAPRFLELYDCYPRDVQKADFFRILAIHRLGGFYFDLDLEFERSVDPLIACEAVFPIEWRMSEADHQRRHGVAPGSPRDLEQIGNFAFGSVAGHPFLEAILAELVASAGTFQASNVDVLATTGPDLINRVMVENRDAFHHRVTLLPMPTVEGVEQRDRFGEYAVHCLQGGWRV